MVTHGFAIVETGSQGRVAYLLLDEANLYYADPFGVAFSPDGKRLYISSSGVNAVSVLDMERVTRILQATDGKIMLSDETAAI
jgi:DNA-binding beta-propeller fold protein YncE